MGVAEDIEARALPLLREAGIELVELQYRREGAGWVLRFVLDKSGGIGLSDCAEWSHRLGEWVEGSGLIVHDYNLEVSSPGLNRPLKKREDFERFAGIEAIVKTFAPINNQRNFHGRIEKIEGEDLILLDRTNGLVRVPLAGIASAKLDPPITLDDRTKGN
ncbi:MAG: ribosome maturation factor RimP [Elusimicrobia bacterium]|jgi:ribosome maturation factor RimP|nr:ribosome maturation factor RimP [Elusimicrobiota bacterium]MBK7208413.1 ribosome maturation factor RimP [Elusimicrobiota bacterium]MBK7545173.1 ribosome maturation factor RimP [Elusimicrobiota bacterium]MBK7574694.1 ribosome maturation factor RimP [Elusimicrobiota bacterium]MBK7688732.1 ribosome maturation factor RimP [Elusimicrobiota bacterium]